MERMKCAAQKTTITDECPAWQPDARQFPTVRTDLGSRALNSEMSFCTKGSRQIIALTDDDDTVKSKCWDRSWRRKFVCKGERRERERIGPGWSIVIILVSGGGRRGRWSCIQDKTGWHPWCGCKVGWQRRDMDGWGRDVTRGALRRGEQDMDLNLLKFHALARPLSRLTHPDWSASYSSHHFQRSLSSRATRAHWLLSSVCFAV